MATRRSSRRRISTSGSQTNTHRTSSSAGISRTGDGARRRYSTMSSTAAVAAHGAHAEHHELSFLRTYIFSEDHKMIGRQFLFMALFMMSIGGLMAMLMRLDLAWPDEQWKFLG